MHHSHFTNHIFTIETVTKIHRRWMLSIHSCSDLYITQSWSRESDTPLDLVAVKVQSLTMQSSIWKDVPITHFLFSFFHASILCLRFLSNSIHFQRFSCWLCDQVWAILHAFLQCVLTSSRCPSPDSIGFTLLFRKSIRCFHYDAPDKKGFSESSAANKNQYPLRLPLQFAK